MPTSKFQIAILYFILLTFTKAQHDPCSYCDQQHSLHNICYNNGKVYPNNCRALCSNRSNKKVFTCSKSSSLNSCVRQCAEAYQSRGNSITHSHPVTTVPTTTTTVTISYGYQKLGYKTHRDCVNSCPRSIGRDYICATDNKIYPSECHARCSNINLKWMFKCGNFTAISACERKCTSHRPTTPTTRPPVSSSIRPFPNYTNPYSNYPGSYKPTTPVWPVKPVTPVTPPTISRPCLKEDWVCGSDGKIYWGTCDAVFNASNFRALFNCTENNILKKRRCKRLCRKFHHSPCINSCTSGRRKTCFDNGKVMKNQCLAGCLNLKKVFDCRQGRGLGRRRRRRKNCNKRCMNTFLRD